MVKTITFVGLCLMLLKFNSCDDNMGEREMVIILFRHGARAPISTYVNDPHKDPCVWNGTEWGQLTDQGKRQQFNLGKYLKRFLKGFLPAYKYSDKDIYVCSTDVERTIMSALCNLAALYEPDGDNWSTLKWQPVPVHTTPAKLDRILLASAPCPKYDQLLSELQNSVEFQQLNDNYSQYFDYVTKHSGKDITSVEELVGVYMPLFIEDFSGLPLPEWTKAIYPQPLKALAETLFATTCKTPELARLKVGNLINEILTHFNDKINGVIPQKVWMYSAHDITLVNLMSAVGIFNGHIPPFCATLFIELRKKQDKYFVWFRYMNSTNADIVPYTLQVPGCEKLCPIDKFSELMKPIIPEDWDKECQSKIDAEPDQILEY